MQHILHDYTHKLTPSPTQYTLHSDTDSGEDSGGTTHIEEVGILEGEAIVGRLEEERLLKDSRGVSSDIGSGRGYPGSGVNGGVGTTGAGRWGGWASRAQRAEDLVASATVSPVAPSCTRKRRRDTVTQITHSTTQTYST